MTSWRLHSVLLLAPSPAHPPQPPMRQTQPEETPAEEEEEEEEEAEFGGLGDLFG